MSADDERVYAELEVLRQMQLLSMRPYEYKHFQQKITDLQEQYKQARALETDANASEEQRKYAKDVGDAIAKGLPVITRGMGTAIIAFDKGDAITGSAAIMDICAAAAPMIATILGAAGPEGMLVGSLFSVIGTILSFFGPKQPSMVDQISDLLKELDAEAQLVNMEAVRLSIAEYDKDLTDAYSQLAVPADPSLGLPPPILRMPLETEIEAARFEQRLGAVDLLIARSQTKFDVPQFTTWKVAAWLKLADKANYPRWSDVLTVWCRTYSDLVTARMKFICLIDPKLLDDKVQYTLEKTGKSPLPPITKGRVNERLINLQSRAQEMRHEAVACNEVALDVLRAVSDTARAWGMFAMISTDFGFYFASGPAKIRDPNWVKRSDINYYHRLTFLPATENARAASDYNLKPRYHCLMLKSNGRAFPGDPGWHPGAAHDWMDHFWVRDGTFDISNDRLIRDYPLFTDVCAAQVNDQRIECWVGVSDGVQAGSLDATGQYNTAPYAPGPMVAMTKSAVTSVRAVYPVIDSLLADDPDRDSIAPGTAGLDRPVVYGGLRDAAEISVTALGGSHLVASPWPRYNGIAADKHFLWVFQPFGLACATHASVLACIQNKRVAPRWMQYGVPTAFQGRFLTDNKGNRIGPDNPHAVMDGQWGRDNHWQLDGGPSVQPMPPLKGLTALSPCDDGTLTACITYREASTNGFDTTITWQAFDRMKTYTIGYSVDVPGGTIHMDEPWLEMAALAHQIHKMPVACWPLFASLKTRLELQG